MNESIVKAEGYDEVKSESLPLLDRSKSYLSLPAEDLGMTIRRQLVVGLLIGAATGLAGALVGLGGGIVLTPLLTQVLGVSQKKAHGTSLITVTFVCLTGAISYFRHGMVALTFAILTTLIAVIGSRASSIYAQKVNEDKLRWYFSLFLIAGALILYSKNFSATSESTLSTAEKSFRNLSVAALGGVVSGSLSGLLGIGGGTVLVPTYSFGLGLSQQAAQGTALAAGTMPSVVGAATYISAGNYCPELLLGILPGSILGSVVGGNLAVHMNERMLRTICSALLLFTGVRSLLKTKAMGGNKVGLASVPAEGFLFGDEGKVHYQVVGQTETGAKPLLLLHMAPRSMDEFREFLVEWKSAVFSRRPIILLDLPGFGGSVRAAEVTISELASFLWKCLDQLGTPDVDIFGHLLGAHVALAMATTDPKRVGKLVLADPIYLDDEARQAVAAWGRATAEVQRDAKGKFLLKVWSKRADYTDIDISFRSFCDEITAQDNEDTLSYSISKTSMEELLPKDVTCDAKIIWAGKTLQMFDKFSWRATENTTKMEAALKPAQVTTIPDAGVDGLCTHGAEYLENVFTFLDNTLDKISTELP